MEAGSWLKKCARLDYHDAKSVGASLLFWTKGDSNSFSRA
jgi:hypothetical protein